MLTTLLQELHPQSRLKEQTTNGEKIPSPSLRDSLHQRVVALKGISMSGGETNGLVPDPGPSIPKNLSTRHPLETPSLHQHPVHGRNRHHIPIRLRLSTIPLDLQISSGPTMLSTRTLAANQLQVHSPTPNKRTLGPFLITLASGFRVTTRTHTHSSTANHHQTHPSRPISRTLALKHNRPSLEPPQIIRSRPVRT